MSKIIPIIVTILLIGIVCLQILSALNVFPKQRKIQICPVDAISMRSGKAVIDLQKCIGCRRCVEGVEATIPKPAFPATDVTFPKQNTSEQNNPPVVSEPPRANAIKPQKPAAPKTEEVVVSPKPAHMVDRDKCIACQLCIPNCPVNAISMVAGKAWIDPEKCINCGICKNGNGDDFSGCPVAAISSP